MNGRARRTMLLITTMVGLAAAGAARAELSCSAAVDRRQVATGGSVVLTLSATGEVREQPRHEPPSIPGVDVVPGGTSQSYNISGRRQEISVTGTYYLQVRGSDDFTVPAVTFTAGGETCTTDPIAIAVVAGPPPTQSGNRGPRPSTPVDGGGAAGSGERAGGPGEPVYITLTVDRQEVWIGQQIVLTFRYHRRRSSLGQPTYTPPRTEGFWRVDLPPERNFRQSVGGHVYEVTELRYALFATRAGDLTIEPARLILAGDPFERFFGRRGRGPRQLETDPIGIAVRELPLPRPERFSGIVADRLDFTATVDRDTVPRGEPVGLTLDVTADGFLKSFAGVDLPEPEGLRLHDASETLREDVTGPRYRALFRQEKALVPTREGTVALPDLELVFFDTGLGRYATVTAAAPPLVVTPSDLPVLGDDPSGFRRTEIARLGRDLAFVRGASGALRSWQPPLPARPLWWVALLAPWGLLGLYRLRLQRQAADARDPAGRRRRTAWPRARAALSALRNDGDPSDLAHVISGYVADRSGRAAAGLTGADVRAWAADLGAEAAGGRLADILAACDRARFGAGAADTADLADETRRLLKALDRRGGRGGRGMGTALLLSLSLVALGGAAEAQQVAPPVDASPGVDPARLLAEGNRAYTDGEIDHAVVLYRQALARGADDAVLHYDLGNAHARRGELGRAIASYLRAIRLSPRDRDARANLAWVRSHTRDLELAGGGLPPVVTQLDAAAHALSLNEWSAVLAAWSWLVVGLVAWTWYRGWLSAGLRRSLILAGGLLVLVAVVTVTRWYEEQVRAAAVVIVEEVEVRSGPATTFPVVFRIHDGLTLVVRGERDDWVRVGLGGDWVGWVPAGSLERVRVPAPQGR